MNSNLLRLCTLGSLNGCSLHHGKSKWMFSSHPPKTLIGAFNNSYSVADARRTSPSDIVTLLPSLDGFGSGKGFSTYIILYSNGQPSLG